MAPVVERLQTLARELAEQELEALRPQVEERAAKLCEQLRAALDMMERQPRESEESRKPVVPARSPFQSPILRSLTLPVPGVGAPGRVRSPKQRPRRDPR